MRLKKINKTPGNNPLVQYAANNPNNTWENFRGDNAADYKEIRQDIFTDQGGLCAYCEAEVQSLSENLQRVEHFHSKSDDSNEDKNWGLDWHNVFGVCVGGSGHDTDKKKYLLPANLSCDAHKAHLIDKHKLSEACEGYFINPLELIAIPCLFGFEKATGELFADILACAQYTPRLNQYGSVVELVEKTIDILNLNCERLKDARREVLKSYNQEVAKARKANDRKFHEKLARRWFGTQWRSYFSTRRALLDSHAEAYLQSIGYNG